MYKNPQDIVVFMGAAQTPASLTCPVATHTFAFNPDEVKWNLTNNTISRDTIGGRVVQLLSSRVDQMTVIGRAGSRGDLQQLALNLKKIMKYQIESQNAVYFKVPSRKWNFKVYIQNVSSLGWDYAATSYPYELTLLVEKDLTGLAQKEIEQNALERLAEGIGYSEELHGGNSEDALSTSEAHLNAIGYLRGRGIDAEADPNPGEDEPGSGGGGGGSTPDGRVPGSGEGTDPLNRGPYIPVRPSSGGNATLANRLLAKANLNTVPQKVYGTTLSTLQIYRLAYWALNQLGSADKQTAKIITAIALCESSGNTRSTNRNATNGTAYGIWQMNEGLGTSLYDPVVSALRMAESYFKTGWAYWGPGPDHKKTYESRMPEVETAVGRG